MLKKLRSLPVLLLLTLTLSACGLGSGGNSRAAVSPTAVAPQPTTVGLAQGTPQAPLPVGETASPAATASPAEPTETIVESTIQPSPALTAQATTEPPGEATAEPTVEPTQAPVALPSGYRRFTSKVNPYTIGYPRAWTVRGDALASSGLKGDLFIRQQRGQVAASVNVIAEEIPAGTTLSSRQYLDISLQQIRRQLDVRPQRTGQTTVAGERAYLIRYQDKSRPQQTVEITQALWVAGGRGWVVTLGNVPGERRAGLPVFNEMLKTFQLRPGADAR